MDFTNIQLIVFTAIGVIVLIGIVFVIQDARAHRRHEEKYSQRKQATAQQRQQKHEHA